MSRCKRRINLRLILAASLRDLGLSAARSTNQLRYHAHNLARLNSLHQPRRHACDERDFAFRLR